MVNRRDRSALGGRGTGDGVAIAKHAGESGRGLNVVGSGRMGGALGLRPARCEPFGRGLSGAAREQPATFGIGPARTVGGVLWDPRGARTANGRTHLGWAYVVVSDVNRRERASWVIEDWVPTNPEAIQGPEVGF